MAKGSRLRPLAKAVLRTQSDERLVRLVREGRDAAFEEIVRRYRQPLVAFAAAYAPPGDPEDVVQESLTRSWQALRESTGDMNLKPWLYTIVRNRALNARRDNRLHEPLTDEIDGVRQPTDIVLTNEELARVVTAVGALPEQQREALVRSAVDGHTHEQIAAAIGATPGAVRQLIFRGRAAVRQGVGLLIPLPLVRMLSENGAVAEAGAGGAAAASGGAALAGGGAGAGASLATKAAIVAAVGAVAAGSGVAIKRSHDADKPREPAPRETVSEVSSGGPPPSAAAAAPIADSVTSGPGPTDPATDADPDGPGSGSSDAGQDDASGHGSGEDHGAAHEPRDDSGPSASPGSSGESDAPNSHESGPPESPGSSDEGHSHGPDDAGDATDSSGPGESTVDHGSDASGGGSSGSDSSGSGSSSSGHGSEGGSESSGSGSGDQPDDDG